MDSKWIVVIEEVKSTRFETELTVQPTIYYHHWEAENAAKKIAESYKPRSLLAHRQRSILKTKSGELKVLIFGIVSRAHFTVYVAELVSGDDIHEAFNNKHTE